nr:ATPase [Sutcliffiella horikoshii]
MGLLYLIGFLADINFLVFKWSPSYTEISLLPIGVGLLLGYISERIIKDKAKSNQMGN